MTEVPKTTFELINQLIVAISQLLWPILIFLLTLLFRKEISGILKRLKKGKIFGQEVELDIEISEFKNITKRASESIPQEDKKLKDADDEVKLIFSISSEDPKIGIILLSREIEKELIKITASMGLLNDFQNKSARQAFKLLEERNYITKSVLGSVKIFWDLRNQIIHGKNIEDERQLIQVLDIGVTLLNTLKALPHAKHIVFKSNLELFSDDKCKNKRHDVVGLILESFSSGGFDKHIHVLPTRKLDYIVGSEVAWEWNMNNIWNETWYIDSESKEIKTAWSEAAEFVGRPIKEI